MKAILINSIEQTVTEIEYSGNWRDISKLIGCDLFTVVNMGKGDTIFVDDEGLLKDPQYFFKLDTYRSLLAGNGLILGSDDEGESIACKVTVEEMRSRISFINRETLVMDSANLMN
jgi:hypothetical protein